MRTIIRIYFYIFFIIISYTFISCRAKFGDYSFDLKKNILITQNNPSLLYDNDYAFDCEEDSSFDPPIKDKTIYIGQTQSEVIHSEEIYKFNLSEVNGDKIVIHFYPLDCNIKIVAISNKNYNVNLKKIKYYEYGSYYAIIEKKEGNDGKEGEEEPIYFKIKTIINSLEINNKYRSYYLTINSFYYEEDNSTPKLDLIETWPTFLFFNSNNNKTMELIYQPKKNASILISFYIKERINFNISIEENGEEKENRLVSYIDKILIDDCSNDLNIKITKVEEDKNATMIIKIIENYTPIYLQNNILNFGFISKNASYQYFYMEVFNREEGEIILNNKRYNGKLIGKLIPKTENENITLNTAEYPKENDTKEIDDMYLLYDKNTHKLIFEYIKTENKCRFGCYLLISYYYNKKDNNNNDTNKEMQGFEFTLLSRIWDKEKFESQIINMPLNEYFLGNFDPTFSSNYVHYYSMFIPDKTKNITIEIQRNDVQVCLIAKKGIVKINPIKQYDSLLYLKNNYTEKMIIDLDCSEIDDQYISFAFFYKLNSDSSFSSYYFRVLQKTNSNFILYPLESNKANLCKSLENNGNYSCFLLIQDLGQKIKDNEIIIYSYGEEKLNYTAWPLTKDEYNSLNLNNIQLENKKEDNRTFFRIKMKEADYILLRINSTYSDDLIILSYFYDNLVSSPFLDLYSYQLFLLNFTFNSKIELDFNSYYLPTLRININSTIGNGIVKFNKNGNDKISFSGKIMLSFFIYNNSNSLLIETNKYSLISIKIEYKTDNCIIKELRYENDIKYADNKFPIGFYLKDFIYKGTDINFYFTFQDPIEDNNDEDLLINGYLAYYSTIKEITNEYILEEIDLDLKNTYDLQHRLIAKYDYRTNNGLIIFDKEFLDNFKGFKFDDIYYLMLINRGHFKSNFSVEVYSSSKNATASIPHNKYISGKFNLLKNRNIQTQRYYIQNLEYKKGEYDYIIDFSSNYENIELKFDNSIIELKKKIIDGAIQKYYVNIFYSDIISKSFFDVKMTDIPIKDNNVENNLNFIYYMFKCYKDVNEEKIENYLFNFSIRVDYKNSKLKIKNNNANRNDVKIYNYFYYLNVYQKSEILKDEYLNTITLTDSKIWQSIKIINRNASEEVTFNLNPLPNKIEYVAALFIKAEDNNIKYYNSITYNLLNDEKKKTLTIVIFCLIVFIIVILFLFFLIYKKIRKKNERLKEKVEEISFSSGLSENDLMEEDNKKSKNDDDYETTFI